MLLRVVTAAVNSGRLGMEYDGAEKSSVPANAILSRSVCHLDVSKKFFKEIRAFSQIIIRATSEKGCAKHKCLNTETWART